MADSFDDEKKRLAMMDEAATPRAANRRPGAKAVGNKIRSIHPLGMRVVIHIRREENVTDTGLYLPEGAKEAKQESLLGEVLEVASAIDRDTKEEANISGIPEGALVLIPKGAGIAIPWDDDLRVVDTKEVLAIVEEADLI